MISRFWLKYFCGIAKCKFTIDFEGEWNSWSIAAMQPNIKLHQMLIGSIGQSLRNKRRCLIASIRNETRSILLLVCVKIIEKYILEH